MLDGQIRRTIDPAMDALGRRLAARGVAADTVTLLAFLAGLAAAGLIAAEAYLAGLVVMLASRFGDGLDGAVARASGKTDFGGFLDIVLDFVFYGAIPLGFVIADPAANAVAGGVLVFSFYVNGSSFLAYAVMAERRGLETAVRGSKSLYFTTGLAEATETILVFVAACLFPGWFAWLAYGFAAVCFYTAFARIMLAQASFGGR